MATDRPATPTRGRRPRLPAREPGPVAGVRGGIAVSRPADVPRGGQFFQIAEAEVFQELRGGAVGNGPADDFRATKLFDEAEYTFQPQAGDEIPVAGNRRVRVTAVIPVEKVQEFVSRPVP